MIFAHFILGYNVLMGYSLDTNPTVEEDEFEKEQKEEQHQIMLTEYGELANVFDQTTIERFREMNFKGLEITQDTEPAELEMGKVGIATSYDQISN